ncbi:SphA family protein [Terracidiphilus gabretensis]|uniref:SphA family protein n=1 Tax=Terracidiphilus gabretensis TaxID=1577687 RepID=UPI0018D1F9A9|nr:transporter [Terracidiphilus gabretensis]
MKLHARVFLVISVALLIPAFLSVHRAFGQQAGHYIGGATGLENGSTAPPGFFLSFLPVVERVDALKGPGGATIAKPDINVIANMVAYAVTTQKKILGADYGLSVIIPVVNTRFTANLFNASAESAGLSDIYFAPLVFGWEKGNANYTVNYGFYAPSGDFDPASPLNPGLGFWEHQIQAGATYSIGKPKLWNTSFLTTWEINHSKIGLAVTPGPMLTGEYSFGRRFDKYQMNAGIAGYGYKKLSADSGSGINPLLAGITDRSFGIGPEWKYTKLKWRLGFDLRYEQQFAVQAKTSGSVFVIGITYLDLAPPKPKK